MLIGMVLALAGLLSAGFDLSDSAIRQEEIQDAGIPVDGIPALRDPEYLSQEEADEFLQDEDRILGVVWDGTARAYPLRVLNWHEVVNDQIGGVPLLVTYCPLSGSARAFEASVEGQTLEFGVSGKLYKSNVLLYDRQTKSLWIQFEGRAVTGPQKGKRLKALPVVVTEWRVWKNQNLKSKVLSLNTGYLRDYHKDPYSRYAASEVPMFPVGEIRQDLAPKTWILGVVSEGKAKAYPLARLRGKTGFPIEDRMAGRRVTIDKGKGIHDFKVTDSEGKELNALPSYWFAWQAFFPETEVYRE